MSVQYWRNGRPTEAAIEAFTEGDCWVLALALWRRYGYPIYEVGDSVHWVVRVDQDRYLDVEGVHTRASLLKHWEEDSLRKAGKHNPIFKAGGRVNEDDEDCIFEASWRRAPIMAKRLIEAWGPR